MEPIFDQSVEALRRIEPVATPFPSLTSSQKRYAFVDRRDREDGKLARCLAWIAEVVDVDPIGRTASLAGSLLKNLLDRALGTHAVRPDDEQVESRFADTGSERERVEGALLADKPVSGLNIGCRLE